MNLPLLYIPSHIYIESTRDDEFHSKCRLSVKLCFNSRPSPRRAFRFSLSLLEESREGRWRGRQRLYSNSSTSVLRRYGEWKRRRTFSLHRIPSHPILSPFISFTILAAAAAAAVLEQRLLFFFFFLSRWSEARGVNNQWVGGGGTRIRLRIRSSVQKSTSRFNTVSTLSLSLVTLYQQGLLKSKLLQYYYYYNYYFTWCIHPTPR